MKSLTAVIFILTETIMISSSILFCSIEERFDFCVFSMYLFYHLRRFSSRDTTRSSVHIRTESRLFSTKVADELAVTLPYFFTLYSKAPLLNKTLRKHTFGYGLPCIYTHYWYICKTNREHRCNIWHCCASISFQDPVTPLQVNSGHLINGHKILLYLVVISPSFPICFEAHTSTFGLLPIP